MDELLKGFLLADLWTLKGVYKALKVREKDPNLCCYFASMEFIVQREIERRLTEKN